MQDGSTNIRDRYKHLIKPDAIQVGEKTVNIIEDVRKSFDFQERYAHLSQPTENSFRKLVEINNKRIESLRQEKTEREDEPGLAMDTTSALFEGNAPIIGGATAPLLQGFRNAGESFDKGNVGEGILDLTKGTIESAVGIASTPITAPLEFAPEVVKEGVGKAFDLTLFKPIRAGSRATEGFLNLLGTSGKEIELDLRKAGLDISPEFSKKADELLTLVGGLIFGGFTHTKARKFVEKATPLPEIKVQPKSQEIIDFAKELKETENLAKVEIKPIENKPVEGLTFEGDIKQNVIKPETKVSNAPKTEKSTNITEVTPEGKLEIVPEIKPSEIKPEAVFRETKPLPEQKGVSITNEDVNVALKQRGMTEVQKSLRKAIPETYNQVIDQITSGEINPLELAKEVNQRPTKLGSTEQSALHVGFAQSMNKVDKVLFNIEKATKEKDFVALETLNKELKTAQANFDLMGNALDRMGSDAATTLRFRQEILDMSDSPAILTRRLNAASAGREIPLKYKEKFDSLIGQLQDAKKQIEQYKEREANTSIDNFIKDTGIKARRTKRAVTKQELASEWDSLSNELYKTLASQVNAGIPVNAIPIIGKMAVNRVQLGVTNAEALVDEVYNVLKDKVPGIERRDVRDAISGYGMTKEMSRKDLDVQLRNYKRELRELSKIEDIEAGKEPLKSGLQRDVPSQAVKTLEDRRKIITQIKGLNEQIKTGKAESKKREVKEYDNSLKDLVAEREALKEQLKQRSKKDPIVKQREQIEKQISAIEERIKSGDFTRKKREVKEIPDELIDLYSTRDRIRQELNLNIKNVEKINWSKTHKFSNAFYETYNLTRSAFQPVGDMSAILRQNRRLTLRHPVLAMKSAKKSFQAMFNTKVYDKIQSTINYSPNKRFYDKFGLDLTDMVGVKEEFFKGSWAEKIPIWKNVVMGSNRAFTSYSNLMRTGVFDMRMQALEKLNYSIKDPKNFKLYADEAKLINILSGRGTFGKFASGANIASEVFYSPRNLIANVQAVTMLFDPTLSKVTRMELAKTWGTYVSANLATIYMAKLFGAEVEDDARSSDFGKIRIGNTRIDMWGGDIQMATLIARLITGQFKSSSSELITPLDSKQFGSRTRLDILTSFFINKLHPSLAIGRKALANEGKEFGQEFDAIDMMIEQIQPFILRDIVEAIDDLGLEASPLALVGFFGSSIQVYKGNTKTSKFLDSLPTNQKDKLRNILQKQIDTNYLNEQQKKDSAKKGEYERSKKELDTMKKDPIYKRFRDYVNKDISNPAKEEKIIY
jgi:soluble cytochrome b562